MEIDGKEITGMYLGDQEISNAYVGDKEVFSQAPAVPLYAAYTDSALDMWVYAKYPLDGSRVVYYVGNKMPKASSSSQLTAQTQPLKTVTEERVITGGTYSFTYVRDRSADLYT